MSDRSPTADFISGLKTAPSLKGQVAYHHQFDPVAPDYDALARPWPPPMAAMLADMGVDRLFAHQVQAINKIRDGRHVVAATPTASGKTLTYALPVFEAVLQRSDTCALFIYPLKALAQDQLKTIDGMAAHLTATELHAAIYDGDTSSYRRKKIRDNPPHILMTNPEMIHLSICPYHDRWSELLARLRFVVVDEVHSYRGILGSHMAQVFRRLMRLCRHYGSDPTFVFTSATVANPTDLAYQLTGLSVATVSRSTAGSGKRHLLVIDPLDGPLSATLLLLTAALNRSLRTIIYTQSRKLAELLAIWAQNRAGDFADRISAYRAGFLPAERREIEAKLASGELLAVISTSALELGIDIGSLDLCLLVGYPGSIVATWQRGGRVGRGGQESAVVLIASEDALDQFFIKNPHQLVERPPEAAVVNASNPDVVSQHLVCAAAELPLKTADPILVSDSVQTCFNQLVAEGKLYLSADGRTGFSPRKRPHRQVDLRGSGSRFAVLETTNNRLLGEIDGFRVYREAHPGAIYLHRGQTYRVEALDSEVRKVHVSAVRSTYHTRVRSSKDTRILEILDHKPVYATIMVTGRLRVTEQVSGYDRIDTRSGKILERCSLDLPPMVFDTQGLWFPVPPTVIERAEKEWIHVMGGAACHGTCGHRRLSPARDGRPQ